MGGGGAEKLADDAGALPAEADMTAQVGVDPVIGQGTEQDDERQDGQQQRGPEQDDRVGEVDRAELSEEGLGRRAFVATVRCSDKAALRSTGTGPHGETK